MADDNDTLAPDAGNPAEVATQDAQTADAVVEPVKAEAEPEKVIAPDWPDDWRDKLAKGDDKARKRLDRFQSPADVMKSWQELERRMSSGEVKAKLPDNATEEQIAAWRKDNGIPDKPDGYLEKLPNGLVIGDEDKPILEGYLARVHGKNASPEIVADTVAWYYAQQEETIAAQAEADKAYGRQSEDALRAEWGGEYRANVNSVMSFLKTAPADDNGTPLSDLLMGARMADGTLFGSNPAALRWLARLANDANPAGFVAPGAGGSQIDAINTELDTIRKAMRENRAAYDKDEKMQERFRTLLLAQEKLSAR